jgi:starch-binding outer membrane protein, SusD/RagB family
MKTNIFFTGLILTLFLSLSCSEDLLDKKSESLLIESGYFQTQEDFIGALTGCYASIAGPWGGYSQNLMCFYCASGDEFLPGAPSHFIEFKSFGYDPSHETISRMWLVMYEGIMRCNQILEKINKHDFELKERIIAETKYLRAFYNFHIVTLWGNAPLILKRLQSDEDMNVQKSRPSEFWAQIEKDLKEAIPVLPGEYGPSDIGRATSWAAIGLLGKSYLYKACDDNIGTNEDYIKAAAEFKKIIESGRFELVDNFNFVCSIENENNSESLYEIQYKRFQENPWYAFGGTAAAGQVKNFLFSPKQVNGQQWFLPTQKLVNEFEKGDLRLGATFYSEGDTMRAGEENVAAELSENPTFDSSLSPTGFCWKKNLEPLRVSEQPGGFGDNYVWMRLADVYLMYSEAVIQGGLNEDWKIYANKIRARAGLGTVDQYLETFGGTEMDYIKHERKVELALEYHRFNDLRRWGDALSVLSERGFQKKHYYLPIPQNEIDLSNTLTQNENW